MTIQYVEFDRNHQDFVKNQDTYVLGGAPFRAIFNPAKLTLTKKDGTVKNVLTCRMAIESEAKRFEGDTLVEMTIGDDIVMMATSRYDDQWHMTSLGHSKAAKARACRLANKMIAFVSQHWLSDLQMDDDETAAWKAIESI